MWKENNLFQTKLLHVCNCFLSQMTCATSAITRNKVACIKKWLWKLLQKSSQKLWSRQHWPKGTMFCPNAPSPSSSHISFGCWPRSRQADGYMPYCFFFAVTGHLKYFCYICAVFTQLSSQHFQITTHFLVLLFSWLVNQTIFWCCCFLARFFFFPPKIMYPCILPFLKSSCSFGCLRSVKLHGWFLG